MLIRTTQSKVSRQDVVVQEGGIHEGTLHTILLEVALAFSLISTSSDLGLLFQIQDITTTPTTTWTNLRIPGPINLSEAA